jgi:hypothetical protein
MMRIWREVADVGVAYSLELQTVPIEPQLDRHRPSGCRLAWVRGHLEIASDGRQGRGNEDFLPSVDFNAAAEDMDADLAAARARQVVAGRVEARQEPDHAVQLSRGIVTL